MYTWLHYHFPLTQLNMPSFFFFFFHNRKDAITVNSRSVPKLSIGNLLPEFHKAKPGNLIWEACWKNFRSNWPTRFCWLPLAWAAPQKSMPVGWAGSRFWVQDTTYCKIKHFCFLLVGSSFGDVDLAHVGLRGGRLYRFCRPTVLESIRDVEVFHSQHVLQGLHGGVQGFSHLGKTACQQKSFSVRMQSLSPR